jgi:hypothetical protein
MKGQHSAALKPKTHMKQTPIGTKSQGNAIIVQSLFKPVNGQTLTRVRHDLGKYKMDGSFIGRIVETSERCFALWMEKRRDSDGPYRVLYGAYINP